MVRPAGDNEWHALSAVVYDRLAIAYCRKQWSDAVAVETGSHDKRLRCDVCVGRVIEAARIGVGLEELERAMLWEREMPEW